MGGISLLKKKKKPFLRFEKFTLEAVLEPFRGPLFSFWGSKFFFFIPGVGGWHLSFGKEREKVFWRRLKKKTLFWVLEGDSFKKIFFFTLLTNFLFNKEKKGGAPPTPQKIGGNLRLFRGGGNVKLF